MTGPQDVEIVQVAAHQWLVTLAPCYAGQVTLHCSNGTVVQFEPRQVRKPQKLDEVKRAS